jgi:hypothetical protein
MAVELPEDVVAAHDAAVARGDEGYLDPATGLYVMTAAFLRARGACCDTGCRHCPYRVGGEGSGGERPHQS